MKLFILIIACMLGGLSGNAQTKKTEKPLGMFIMNGASCAGLKFNSETSATFINEIGCSPWELRVKWIDEKKFFTVEKERKDPNLPPRVMIFEIISYDGKTLKLKEYWTGWGDQKDEIITYVKEK
ncbi:hypothetical protein [uncultured Flavobacterium sp.]|uniref:hypothetical protein n=1 Tax=uncultured Flavobacterium sp. TaxID=165435 RepID=UPI0025CD93E1|nr:hypothetical protein [uncultured Flavobacterium sp.]